MTTTMVLKQELNIPSDMNDISVTRSEIAEQLNGRLAMLGVVAALGAYALTGQIIPGVW